MPLQSVANLGVSPLAPSDSLLPLEIQQKTAVPWLLPLLLPAQTFGILEDATMLIFLWFLNHLWVLQLG